MKAMTVGPDAQAAGRFDHAVVWIDHHSARVVHFDREHWTLAVVHAGDPRSHLHHRANSAGSGRAPEDQRFLHEVARALGDASLVLVTGPASEKHELLKHVERHDPALRARIAAVQPLDHPSDGELLAHARAYFQVEDRLRAQR